MEGKEWLIFWGMQLGVREEGSLSRKMPRLSALICGIFMHFVKARVRNDTKRSLIAFNWSVQTHKDVAFSVKSVGFPAVRSHNSACDKGSW